ncbi:hypothetical protein SAMN05660772_02849 [Pasteurella testudinis DSM 23072]|uniref:Uncharacterized protein n=1 Tax=Pasteurella testudinis DSM 23072 TaxID=1122938 RepID=A0A1W1V5T1_9PAST|nr:hypothetical protein SAMN05660772_02849 [Pasteurella testudinis DSM 23072]SUB52160.1 Uncharacterised protein [Pasteurella testudinis]
MKSKNIFLILSMFDLFYLIIYSFNSFSNDGIPFYTDFLNIFILFESVGSYSLIFSLSGFILFLSLFFSVYCYLFYTKSIFYLSLFQLPLRVICLLPSIPYSIYGFKLIFNFPTIASFIFLVCMEIAKVILIYFCLKVKKYKS